MSLFYVLIGLLLVIAAHFALRWLANAPTHQAKRFMKWIGFIAAVVVVLLLLRFGLPAIAAAFSGFLAITALLSRVMVLFPVINLMRRGAARKPQPSTDAMSVKEAREVLGVDETASREEIKKAYHALMQKLHPDSGGNDYLAAKLNEAKEILLDHHGKA